MESVKCFEDHTTISTNIRNQIIPVLEVAYLCISCGNLLGYTSSAVPSMQEDEDPTFSTVTPYDISWIGGLGPIGALVGSLLTLFTLAKFGSRGTIRLFASPVLIISWVIIGFANSLWMIYLGRFLGGIGSGMMIACAPLYAIEVSSTEIRGKLGILPQFLMIFGILTSYILGAFLNWRNLAFACGIVAFPSILLLHLASDTPNWLARNSQNETALKVLERLHGPRKAAKMHEEIMVNFRNERIRRSGYLGSQRITAGMMKASAVALGILSFQQLTGINGVTFYAVSIFREASNGEMSPHIPSIILASTQLFGSFSSTIFVERFGRKFLLILSSVLLTLSGLGLGLYFYFGTGYSELSFVPLFLLVLFAFGFAIGYGPVAWILSAEILPVEIRHFMSPLSIAYNWFCAFLSAVSFPILLVNIHIYGIFWLYASIACLGLVFVILFVPETKGKSAEEISLFFNCSRKCDLETEAGQVAESDKNMNIKINA